MNTYEPSNKTVVSRRSFIGGAALATGMVALGLTGGGAASLGLLSGCTSSPPTAEPTADAPNNGQTTPETSAPAGYEFDFETKTVTLNDGITMPIIGLGTFMLSPEQAENSVYHALTSGYRLIDAANAYMNEKAVGRGIKKSGVPREDMFITSKLWPSDYEDVERAIDDTLVRLGLDYIDLLFPHQAYGSYIEGYKGLEAALAAGKIRSIGLSNVYEKKFDEIMGAATTPPAVLQNEQNPRYQQAVMREHIKPYEMVLMSWFPLGGRGGTAVLFNDPTIVEIAETHSKTSPQIILRWHLQKGNIVIPGSSNPDHILENISVFDFELSDDEMAELAALDTGKGSYDFTSDSMDFGSFTAPMDFNNQE
jgi:diketogulonate reductase-like aldo/keto reductase